MLALLAVGSIARRTLAEPSAPSAPSVRLFVAAAEPVMEALVDRLRPRLRALRVELAATVVSSVDVDAVLATAPATDERAPLAQVWLDGRSSSDAVIILVPRRADRVLARKIGGGAVFDEVALAEAVFVIERATASLLASRPVGVPKADAVSELRGSAISPAPAPPASAPQSESTAVPAAVSTSATSPSSSAFAPPAAPPSPAAPSSASLPGEPPPPTTPPAAAPEAPPESLPAATGQPEVAPEAVVGRATATTKPPSAFQIGIFVGAESLSAANVLVPDAGLVALVERSGAATRLAVIVDVDLHRTLDVVTSYGTVELFGGGGHALLSFGHPLGRGMARVAAGPGLAVNRASVTTVTTAIPTAGRSRTDFDPTLAAQLRLDLPFARAAGVFVVAGAEVALVSGRYTADVVGESTTLLATWPVRPTLRLGVTFGR